MLADSAVQLARRRPADPADRAGLALAALSSGALAALVVNASRTGAVLERGLRQGLGEDYADDLAPRDRDRTDPGPARSGPRWPDPARTWRTAVREVARPFSVREPDVEVVRDIGYARGGRRARLDVYRPTGVDLHDAPVLVHVHGGGWTIGDKRHQGVLLMHRMARRGWVCVAMNYRHAPLHPFPAQIEDVKRALAWVRAHVAAYGGDPGYLVLTGGSAGGHLAALAALTPGLRRWQPGFEAADTSVAACVPLYGIYDVAGLTGLPSVEGMRDHYLAPYVLREDPVTHREDFVDASPLAHVRTDAPDFLILHGTHDTMADVGQARAMAAALRTGSDAGVTYVELPGAQHMFDAFGSVRGRAAIGAVERWLEHHRAHHQQGHHQRDHG